MTGIVTFDREAALRTLLSLGAPRAAEEDLVSTVSRGVRLLAGEAEAEEAIARVLRLDAGAAATRLVRAGLTQVDAQALVRALLRTIGTLNPSEPAPSPRAPVFLLLTHEELWALVRDTGRARPPGGAESPADPALASAVAKIVISLAAALGREAS